MRSILFLFLFFFTLQTHFSSAQWLPVTSNRPVGDILVTDRDRIIANYFEPWGTSYSDNGGKTWYPLKENASGSQLKLKLLGKQGNRLFGTSDGGVWTSTDNGDSWQLIPAPYALKYTKFKASDKCAVFVSDEYNAEMSISLDNGKTWTSTRIEQSGQITGIDVRSDMVLVCCKYSGIFKGTYTNNKWTWLKISSKNDISDITDIAFIGEAEYITTSIDMGAATYREFGTERFTLKNREGGTERQFEDVFIFGNYWVITTSKTSGKFFVSSDQGKNWKDFSGGLPKPYFSSNLHREVTISRVVVSKDTLYAIVNQELMKRPMNELSPNYLETVTDLKIDTLKRNTHIVKWTDNSVDETGFVIERAQMGFDIFKEAGNVPANTESFTDYDLPGGVTYYYRIKSYNHSTSSRYSETLIVKREANICKVSEKLIYSDGFSSVKFINEKTGFWLRTNSDVASYLLRTDDGGVSWKEVPFHTSIPANSEIKFLDDKVGFIYRFPSFTDEYRRFMTIDGGLTWRRVDNNHKLFMEKYKILRKIMPSDQFFINDSTGFKGSDPRSYFGRTGDYGKSWIPMRIDPNNSNEYVTRIFFTDNKTGFAIASGKIGLTTDGGDSWSLATLPQAFHYFVDIYSPDKKTVYFFGNVDYDIPFILKTTDNGKTFETIKISLNSKAGISSISFVGDKAWITTTLGELYVSNDNLKTWQVISDQVRFYRGLVSFKGKWGLAGADFHSADKGKPMAYMTYDGGRSWKDIKFPSKMGQAYGMAPKVKIFDENKGIVLLEDVLYKTDDRGKTWTTIPQPFNQNNYGFISQFNAASEKVWFLTHRYNSEDYKFYRTTDGGNTWQHIQGVTNPGDLYFFYNLGFVRENGPRWHSTFDGGASWWDFNMNTGSYFNPKSFWFTDPRNGFAAGQGYVNDKHVPSIRRTKDSGNTWEEVDLGNIAVDDYNREVTNIKFFNDKVGYAVLSSGRIIKTSDGGVTWSVTTYDKLFTEYAALIDFDDYYLKNENSGQSRLTHFEPVNPAVKPHQPNGDIDACLYSNASTLYSVDNNDSYSYQWKLSGGGNLSVNRNEAKIKWTQLGTYKLSVRAINDCGVSEWQEIPVTVNSLPAQPTLVSGDLNPCPQTNQTYQLNNTSGYTYRWTIPSTLSNTINKNSAIINWTQENQTFVLKAVSFDNVCTSDTLSFEVKTKALPAVPTIARGATLTSSSTINNQWLFDEKPIEGATQQTLTPKQSGLYSVQVSNECGVRRSANEYIFIQILGMEEEEDNIKLYPNPAHNELIIKGDQFPIQSVYLYDANGKLVETLSDESTTEYRLNVKHLSSGVYVIKIITNNRVIHKKVLIQR